jgi:hypothetical protein
MLDKMVFDIGNSISAIQIEPKLMPIPIPA